MSGAVEDDVGTFFFEYGVNSGLIADVGQAGADVSADPALAELAIDLEKGVFGALEQDQTARTEFHGLAADFRADGAAGAGDEDGFAGEEALQFGRVEADGFAAEEIKKIEALSLCAAAASPPLVSPAPDRHSRLCYRQSAGIWFEVSG